MFLTNSSEYEAEEIAFVLNTAISAFQAAQAETQRERDSLPTLIHTGFGGCGAFGGNRSLMIALQVVAARAAAIVDGLSCRESLPRPLIRHRCSLPSWPCAPCSRP